ncbi:hypothetical protein [Pseudomonas entomophila]|uniref:hypothetical protein n=1 Tax=Pseudomonas entomophila TaxID=312306 RepID=UPI003EBFDB1D
MHALPKVLQVPCQVREGLEKQPVADDFAVRHERFAIHAHSFGAPLPAGVLENRASLAARAAVLH